MVIKLMCYWCTFSCMTNIHAVMMLYNYGHIHIVTFDNDLVDTLLSFTLIFHAFTIIICNYCISSNPDSCTPHNQSSHCTCPRIYHAYGPGYIPCLVSQVYHAYGPGYTMPMAQDIYHAYPRYTMPMAQDIPCLSQDIPCLYIPGYTMPIYPRIYYAYQINTRLQVPEVQHHDNKEKMVLTKYCQ